jgi:hypothetical protein
MVRGSPSLIAAGAGAAGGRPRGCFAVLGARGCYGIPRWDVRVGPISCGLLSRWLCRVDRVFIHSKGLGLVGKRVYGIGPRSSGAEMVVILILLKGLLFVNFDCVRLLSWLDSLGLI